MSEQLTDAERDPFYSRPRWNDSRCGHNFDPANCPYEHCALKTALAALATAERELYEARESNVDLIARHAQQEHERLKALKVYADAANWVCPRCKGRDAINCGLTKWEGPTNGAEFLPGHGYDIARACLAAQQAAGEGA